MLFVLQFASLVFWIFVVGGLVYFVRNAWTSTQNTYKPRTRWNTEYYIPSPDPFLLEDK